jgi:general secretion pathway protein A
MYERFYGLRERPFSLTPDPEYLYPSRVHSEALSHLRYGIEAHAGFVVITGEIGSGKTTLLQTVLRGLDRQTSVSRLVNTMLDARELIEAVMLDFGLEPASNHSKPVLLRDLARFLVDQRMAGRLALLVIDEAQNLSPAALEEVRMLSNLETEKSKLIQVVLVGQPNLRDVLARPELEQLRQRVTVSYHLAALDIDDTGAYINHRLKRAAIGAPLQFPSDVTAVIHRASQGVPRKINVIADALLLFGYSEDRRTIDVDLAHSVLRELDSSGVMAQPHTLAPAPEPVRAAVPNAGRPPEPDARPTLAAAAAADRLAEREREIAVREQALAARERELAEKRRALAEEADRLRQRRAEAQPARTEAQVPAPTWPRRPATAAEIPLRAAAPAPAPLSMTVARALPPDSVWARIRRGILGVGKPMLED